MRPYSEAATVITRKSTAQAWRSEPFNWVVKAFLLKRRKLAMAIPAMAIFQRALKRYPHRIATCFQV